MNDKLIVQSIDGNALRITLRPAREDDKDFCRRAHHQAYCDVCTRQFGHWDEGQQDGFFAEEWQALQLHIIEVDRRTAGCYCSEVQAEQVLLLEIYLVPTFQHYGIGSELIRHEQHKAARLGLPLRLRVLKENRALLLYQCLGFRQTGEDATHILMEWTV